MKLPQPMSPGERASYLKPSDRLRYMACRSRIFTEVGSDELKLMSPEELELLEACAVARTDRPEHEPLLWRALNNHPNALARLRRMSDRKRAIAAMERCTALLRHDKLDVRKSHVIEALLQDGLQKTLPGSEIAARLSQSLRRLLFARVRSAIEAQALEKRRSDMRLAKLERRRNLRKTRIEAKKRLETPQKRLQKRRIPTPTEPRREGIPT
jgi:hypothetical protein